MVFSDLRAEWSDWFPQVRGRMTVNADLAKITWFGVGGPAQLLFQPADQEDLAFFLSHLPKDIPVTVLGLGSNVLVRDGGISGVVIRLSAKGFGGLAREGECGLRVGAAASDKRLAGFALSSGLNGLAFYHGIPGSVGGALRMNAGANGQETKDRLISAVAYDRQGVRHVLSAASMRHGYRHCGAPADLIFTEALFEGSPAPRAHIQKQMDVVSHHRVRAQPVRERTSGSTFKNPNEKSAWTLIDAAGCRGLRIGGAEINQMHCNFMINTGNATAQDLETLGETVRARVFDHCSIELQWEIKRLGMAR